MHQIVPAVETSRDCPRLDFPVVLTRRGRQEPVLIWDHIASSLRLHPHERVECEWYSREIREANAAACAAQAWLEARVLEHAIWGRS